MSSESKKLQDRINAKLKVRAYKSEENPDARESLCGEPVQIDEDDGREFFEVPAHQREYLMKLLPAYDFTDIYEVDEQPSAPRPNPEREKKKKKQPADEE